MGQSELTRPLEAVQLIFRAPRRVVLKRQPLAAPEAGQVEVETAVSGISAGTEMLIYRGLAPRGLPADDVLPGLSGRLAFPLHYGYACVGRVAALGPGVAESWLGRRAFAFQPHASRFLSPVSDLLPVPDEVSNDQAVLLPQVETALSLVHDGAPIAGEDIVVFGQGVVGLLAASLLARIPLVRLVTFDRFPRRRGLSLGLGAQVSLDPSRANANEQARAILGPQGADLAFELSGDPAALEAALALTGFSGRIVIGSWYGRKRADLDLGGAFHRSRIRLMSSQVSRIDPALSGRWDKARRFGAAWRLLQEIHPENWITHRIPFDRAGRAFQLLDHRPGEALQVILTYG